MNEIEFAARHEEEWKALAKGVDSRAGGDVREVPRLFRRAVAELAVARDRQYRTSLLDRLHSLVLTAHFALHGARAGTRRGAIAALWHFFVNDFPLEARRQRRYLLAAGVLFFGPFLGMIAALQWFPDFVYYLVSPETVASFEEMYDPSAGRVGVPRGVDTDVAMFGFYIANNVRIDLQCLAGGIVFGLGTIAALVGNGTFLGTVAGHLTHIGYGGTFWGFGAGHSAPELLGIVLSGAAGLMIGHALVAPGRLPRLVALRERGREATTLLYGAALFTTGAAVIEAFWSSSTLIPFEAKILFGAFIAVVTLSLLVLGGRRGS